MKITRRGFLASVAALVVMPVCRRLPSRRRQLKWRKGKWKDGAREWKATMVVPYTSPFGPFREFISSRSKCRNSDRYRGARQGCLVFSSWSYTRIKNEQAELKFRLLEYQGRAGWYRCADPRIPQPWFCATPHQLRKSFVNPPPVGSRVQFIDCYPSISFTDLFRKIEDVWAPPLTAASPGTLSRANGG